MREEHQETNRCLENLERRMESIEYRIETAEHELREFCTSVSSLNMSGV